MRLGLADRYVEHLSTSAITRGLIGPRELPRLWTRHVLNCAVVGELIPPDCSVIDIGSGAGLPGLAVALARPDLQVTLVEPLERRSVWLQEVVDDLSLQVEVVRARAEELHGRTDADVVTARAVAPLSRLAQWGLPLVRGGGVLLAVKGRSAADELAEAAAALTRQGASAAEVVTCGHGVLEPETTVVRVRVGARGGMTSRRSRGGARRPGGPVGRAPRTDRPGTEC